MNRATCWMMDGVCQWNRQNREHQFSTSSAERRAEHRRVRRCSLRSNLRRASTNVEFPDNVYTGERNLALPEKSEHTPLFHTPLPLPLLLDLVVAPSDFSSSRVAVLPRAGSRFVCAINPICLRTHRVLLLFHEIRYEHPAASSNFNLISACLSFIPV